MIDLNKYAQQLTCEKCGGSGHTWGEDRYFLQSLGDKEEVTKEAFIQAERMAGFRSKFGPETLATAGFSSGLISGHIRPDKTTCTCQDDERAVMNVVDSLNNFYYNTAISLDKEGQAHELADAWIALARMCVARGIEPRFDNYTQAGWSGVAEVINWVTMDTYEDIDVQVSQSEWAFALFHAIYSIADQAGFDLDEAIAKRLEDKT